MTYRMIQTTVAAFLLGVASCSIGHAPQGGVHLFQGRASLPLTGEMAPLGAAFREGFEQGLASGRDSTFAWVWNWHDNEGSPDSLQAWVDFLAEPGHRAPDIALGGIGGVATGVVLDSVKVPLLWMGDGTPLKGAILWPLWPSRDQLLSTLAGWYALQDTPAVALVLADGAWTPPFLEHDSAFPGLVALPHDPGTRRWDREMGQILSWKPKTIVCWNRPEDAKSFVQRKLIAPFLATGRTLLLPEGVPAPEGARVFRFRPLWQPSLPADSLQIEFQKSWGFRVGRALASASYEAARHPTMPWFLALRSAACDTLRVDPASGGWIPRLEILGDSAQP